jgi:hypothetical protein
LRSTGSAASAADSGNAFQGSPGFCRYIGYPWNWIRLMKPNLMVKRQNGMTMMSWLIVLAILVFFILIGIKMIPTYIENYSIRQVLINMENDRKVRTMSAGEMKKSFLKRLKINSVYEFDRKAIQIKKEKFGTRFAVDYEIRKPVAGNVSIVMAFSESALIQKQ